MVEKNRQYFAVSNDIFTFVEANWELLSPMKLKPNEQVLKSTLGSVMHVYSGVFKYHKDVKGSFTIDQDIWKISPCQHKEKRPIGRGKGAEDSMNKKKKTTDEAPKKKIKLPVKYSNDTKKADIALLYQPDSKVTNKRTSTERNSRLVKPAPKSIKKIKNNEVNETFIDANNPFNREEFVYILCDKRKEYFNEKHNEVVEDIHSDVSAEIKAKLDGEELEAAKFLSIGIYHSTFHTNTVVLSSENRSPSIMIDKAYRWSAFNPKKKYRSVKCSHGMTNGSYYFEVWKNSDAGNFRVGFGYERASLQAPVGYDEYGYALRDVDASSYHSSKRTSYGNCSILKNDVVGCLIEIVDEIVDNLSSDYQSFNDKGIVIRYKGYNYFEKKMIPTSKTINSSTRIVKISYFINGKPLGKAFEFPILSTTENIAQALFPMFSLYDSAHITFNPGPTFIHPVSAAAPYSDRFNEHEIEELVHDIVTELALKS